MTQNSLVISLSDPSSYNQRYSSLQVLFQNQTIISRIIIHLSNPICILPFS